MLKSLWKKCLAVSYKIKSTHILYKLVISILDIYNKMNENICLQNDSKKSIPSNFVTTTQQEKTAQVQNERSEDTWNRHTVDSHVVIRRNKLLT